MEYNLKELLNNDNEDIRQQAAILADALFPLNSVWEIKLKQVIK